MTMLTRGQHESVDMKTMAAGSFKTHCLAVMDEVQAKRETIVITKRGKPVVKLVPADAEKDDIYGFLKGKVKIVGDVVSPALTPEEWGDLY
jgi:prevent-host-death family protein